MRTYLVTGGAGFIGSNYIHYMFEKYKNDKTIIYIKLKIINQVKFDIAIFFTPYYNFTTIVSYFHKKKLSNLR